MRVHSIDFNVPMPASPVRTLGDLLPPPPPLQLDFWETNVEPIYYTLPIGISDGDVARFRDACRHRQTEQRRRHENWKMFMWSIRIFAPQLGYKVYRRGEEIIVERIPLTGDALREQMQKRGLWVVK